MEFRGVLVQFFCDEDSANHFFVPDGGDGRAFAASNFRKVGKSTMALFREVGKPHVDELIEKARVSAEDLALDFGVFVSSQKGRCIIPLFGVESPLKMSGFLLHADA